MSTPERIQQLQEAIINHLKAVGPRDWDEVRNDFLEIPGSTFWRHVKKVKEQLEGPVVSNVAADLFSQEEATVKQSEPWEKPKVNSVFRLLNHTQRFYELHSDLLALRQHALDPDGRIRDAQLFAKTIRLRNQLLNDELDVVDGVERADRSFAFFDAIIEEVSNASPEVAKAIMISLNELNIKRMNESNNGGSANPA